MKVLHVTPHLGGGVGKAHAAICAALPKDIGQTFILLEAARDRRYADMIETAGARVVTACSLDQVADLAGTADIVQFEFWNHPRLFACLARAAFPAMRSVFWSHISGLSRPVIQPGVIEQAGRFVFTTDASRAIPFLATLPEAARRNIAVINSGFGFAEAAPPKPRGGTPRIAYLGTVDFVKMHPGFFDAIDRLDGLDIRVSVWGRVDPAGEVVARARAMRHPERIQFGGHTDNPAAALAAADIFFYPLQADHYGTAENALVEAMSLGLTPVVMNNPAETAIVRDRETGLVARSVEECAALLQMLLGSPQLRETMSRNAARHIADTRTPARSAQQFVALWRGMLEEPGKTANFRSVVGDNPANWFLATQCLPGETWQPPAHPRVGTPSKGMFAHFESAFPLDPSLSQLAGVQSGVPR
jgi:glycosyltransferase involved in cell wall biosynthesis